jgi:hypothetical protein
VHEHPRRVQRPTEARPTCPSDLGLDALPQIARLEAGLDLLTGALDNGPGSVYRERIVD